MKRTASSCSVVRLITAPPTVYDRKLLGELARCAWWTVRDLYCAGLAEGQCKLKST